MDNAVFEDEVKPLVNLAKRRVTTRPKNRLPENRRNVQFNESQKLDAISQEHLDQAFFRRFFGNTNKWICRILEFRKKILSLGRKSLSLEGKF